MKQSSYINIARDAIRNPVLRKALFGLQDRFGKGTAKGYLELPEGPELRLLAHDIRRQTIENLDDLLALLAANVRNNGGHVHFALDAETAVRHCLDIAAQHDVRMAVKGKSMLTEEIGLNPALESAGVEVVETDLGEYIIQLAGENPSHIIAPAIHKTRQEISSLFSEKLGIPKTDDIPTLTLAARKALRKKFLQADMGISGCNLACAETGHVTTVSNEGNIRMTTTLPKVYVAFMGMERIVADLRDHQILFRLLSLGAAAQKIGGYVSYLGGPGKDTLSAGPREFHLIIVDNGRSRILADPEFREMLYCLRCGGCLNVCPVYGEIGGHAYASAYSGPVGAVVTPLLRGINRFADLCQGETLCGACMDACPVNIDLPRMLLLLRNKLAEGDHQWDVHVKNPLEQFIFGMWSHLVQHPLLYDVALRLARMGQTLVPKHGQMISRLPFAEGWTRSRDLKKIADQRFIHRYRSLAGRQPHD